MYKNTILKKCFWKDVQQTPPPHTDCAVSSPNLRERSIRADLKFFLRDFLTERDHAPWGTCAPNVFSNNLQNTFYILHVMPQNGRISFFCSPPAPNGCALTSWLFKMKKTTDFCVHVIKIWLSLFVSLAYILCQIEMITWPRLSSKCATPPMGKFWRFGSPQICANALWFERKIA